MSGLKDMIPRVIFVGGLPGSGKTPYLEQLRDQGYEVFDDFQANARENSPHFERARRCEELIQTLRSGRICVVADMRLICPDYRQEAQRFLEKALGSIALEWRFFENDADQCKLNIASGLRASESRLAKLKEYSRKYSVPSDAVRMPVWREKP
ncbi:MAG: hypothetical protein ACRD2N_01470 [Vicinamibacterales bacterium]